MPYAETLGDIYTDDGVEQRIEYANFSCLIPLFSTFLFPKFHYFLLIHTPNSTIFAFFTL